VPAQLEQMVVREVVVQIYQQVVQHYKLPAPVVDLEVQVLLALVQLLAVLVVAVEVRVPMERVIT
jgi:hypothetical protein